MSLIKASAVSFYEMERNYHSIQSTPDITDLLVTNIKVEQTENELGEELATDDYTNFDQCVTENFEVNKHETEHFIVNEGKPLDNQYHETHFVSEKIKFENTDYVDEVETNCHKSLMSNSQEHYYNPITNYEHANDKNKAHSNKLYTCNQCGKGFVKKISLRAHLSTHVERPFKCADCKTCFSRVGALKTHIDLYCTGPTTKRRKNVLRKKFLPATNPYVCAYCEHAYKSQLGLYRHVFLCNLSKYTFTKCMEKLFKCAGCGKCYGAVGLLEKHLSKKCNRKLVRTNVKSLLNENLAVQELDPIDEPEAQMWVIDAGDTPYKCAKCDMSYSKPRELKRHVYAHLKKKLPQTPKYSYITPRSRTNARKNAFKCDTCKLNFTSLSTLNDHLKESKHKTRLYICDDCGNRFLQLKNLKYHMAKFQHWTDISALDFSQAHGSEQLLDLENNGVDVNTRDTSVNIERNLDVKIKEDLFSEETNEKLDGTTSEVELNNVTVKEEGPALDQYELTEQSLELLIHENQSFQETIKQEDPDSECLLGD